MGLSIVVSTLSGIFNKHSEEPSKVAIRRSRITAILRALIHALPLGLALLEIIINWRGHYVGAQCERQAYDQIIAKIYEILIQTSLALIVLSYVRHQTIHGSGIPFGLFLGGLQFLQVSYLWSPELWSSVTVKVFHLRRNFAVFLLLVVCGILAATVGPSSATLLIPRLILWPLESPHFAIRGTIQDVWPDHVDGRNIPGACTVLSYMNASSPCPAGPWKELYNALSEPDAFANRTDLLVEGTILQLTDTLGQGSKDTANGRCVTSDLSQQCASTP